MITNWGMPTTTFATGQKNGTFSQDKLKKYWIDRADKANGSHSKLLIQPTLLESARSVVIGAPKNRSGDEFKCTNCEYENQSHTSWCN